jgi:hypothetical protein
MRFYGACKLASYPKLNGNEMRCVKGVPSRAQISKTWLRNFVSVSQNTGQKCPQIYSMIKFVEQNVLIPILSQNLHERNP